MTIQPYGFRLALDAFVELLWLPVRIEYICENCAKMSLRDPDSHDGSFRNGIGNVPFALSKRLIGLRFWRKVPVDRSGRMHSGVEADFG
jgi:hypothetical protein